jgi:hypothetical protein
MPGSNLNQAGTSLYQMQFMPLFLAQHYSANHHLYFGQEEGIKIRNWIRQQRMNNEAESLIKSNFN